jgi:predicted Na+-dependent transporter
MTATPALLVSSTLFTIMLALGISLRPEALRQWTSRPGLLIRALIGSCLLVPLVALLLLQTPWSYALTEPARYAVALMAVCPSAPLTLRKAGKAGGDRQLAALLQVGAALGAIVSVPVMAAAFRAIFGIEGWDIAPGDVAVQVARVQVLPLAMGLLLRHFAPSVAGRLEGPLDKLANILLLLLIVVVLIKAGPILLPFLAGNLAALALMVVMVVAALAIGYALAGNDTQERTTTSLVTSMRNPGLALLLAGTHGGHLSGVKIGILAYLLITVLVSIPFLRGRDNSVMLGSSPNS